MAEAAVLYEIKNQVGIITLNRPKSLNAINPEVSRLLFEHFQDAAVNESVRAIVLTGAGKGFCSGEDLTDVNDDTSPAKIILERYIPLIKLIRSIEKPIICAVNGVAAGAGFSLVLACDMRIASENASFGQVFVKLGLIPDAGSTYFLPRLVGSGRALEMMLTGEIIDAAEAKRIGLVSKVYRREDLLAQAVKMAERLARSAPLAIANIKKLMLLSDENTLEQQMLNEAEIQEELGHTEDFKEGTRAFLEKRRPVFKGK